MDPGFKDFLKSHTEYPKLYDMGVLSDSNVQEIPRAIWDKHLVSVFGEVTNINMEERREEIRNKENSVFENGLLNMYKTQEKVTGVFARGEKVIAKTQAAVDRLVVLSYLGGKTLHDIWEEGNWRSKGTPLEQDLRSKLLVLRDMLRQPASTQKESYMKQAKIVKHLFQEYLGTFPPSRQVLLKKFIQNDLDQLSAYHKKMK